MEAEKERIFFRVTGRNQSWIRSLLGFNLN